MSFRRAAFAVLSLLAACGPAPTDDAADLVVRDGDEALRALLSGNERFLRGTPRHGHQSASRLRCVADHQRPFGIVLGCAAIGVPLVYFLLSKLGATALIVILGVLFIGLAVMLLVEGIREGAVARDKVVAMLIIFVFNALFWMFFEQAGSSFNFLAQNIVDRMFGS